MACHDCGDSFGVDVIEPLDLRPFGQLRTSLGDPPELDDKVLDVDNCRAQSLGTNERTPMSTPNPSFPPISTGFSWVDPVANVDPTQPFTAAELAGYQIGVRADGTGS